MFILPSAVGLPTVNWPRWLRQAVYRRRVFAGADWLRRRGCSAIELQIWNPEFAAAIDWVRGASTSYHIDDEYSWSAIDLPLSETERALIERVDRVYVTSAKLLETKGGINPRTAFTPNGADWSAFASLAAEPAALSRIPHPRAGYVGVLKEQLDIELLIALATMHGEWSFVFVGPVRAVHTSLRDPLARLASLPNVYLLGTQQPAALPGYLQHIDVALLPYRQNGYTDCINPIKLYEALAAGTPVVGARIRTLLDFSSVVSLADGLPEWSAAIANAIANEQSSARRAHRRTVARAYDWDDIAARIADVVGQRN
jgi:glycosyltransferase involved in cell wall biosynthesis